MFVKRLYLIVITYFFIFLFSHLTNAQEWFQLSPTGILPAPLSGHSAVYDATNNRMTIFGGTAGGADFFNDVQVLSTANGLGETASWTQLSPDPDPIYGFPSRRNGHTAIYDPNNNRMTIFGGSYYYSSYYYYSFNDVWVLSNSNGVGGTTSWTQLFPTGSAPTTRSGHTAIYDATNNRMTIFGGTPDSDNYLNDVWVLSNANGLDSTTSAWTQLFPIGSAPTSRDSHSAVFDATNNRMIIFGGRSGDNTLNDVWVLSNANGLDSTTSPWTQLFPNPDPLYGFPSTRFGHTAVYDTTNNRMTIFGGDNFNDVWVLTNANGLGGIPSWIQISPTGSSPTMRYGHTAVYDPTNNRMTIFGGYNGNYLNDVWVLDGANGLGPTLANVPSLKMYINQYINSSFDLSDYNMGSVATSYSVVSSFNSLSAVTGSIVYQSSYSAATVGTNYYQASNAYGSSMASNQVKFSTYKINKLPHVGLTVGSSWDINVQDYTYVSLGPVIPPSYGNPSSIIISDTTSISATWVGNTIVHITSLQSFSGVVNVDVIASPNANSPFGVDIDKERIQVYNNLWAYGTFSTAQDTASYGYQNYPYNIFPTMSWLSSYTDSAGTQANGVFAFSFSTIYSSVKVTPYPSYYQSVLPGQWYIARMRITSDTPNNGLIADFYAFTNNLSAGVVGDVAANNYYGIPTTWTWIETPILSHTTSTSAFLQFVLVDANSTNTHENVYIDELQWIQATPELAQARSNTQTHYLYGQFTAGSDTTGWGQQLCINVAGAPTISVSSGLVLNFEGALETSAEGIKWTANNGVQGPGHAYTYSVTPGRDVGMRATATLQSGDVNSLWIMLIAAIGVQTSGQQSINPPCNIIASAQVGALTGGEYRTVGTAIDPYYQFQFEVRGNQPSVLVLNDVDFDTDNDDPNFGDPTLFP